MNIFVVVYCSKCCNGFQVAERLGRRDPCAKCGLPVFIAERLLVNGRTLYHRTCFRCARCQHQLSLANFYETEGGEYCCETCPDEVLDTSSNVEEDKSQVASQNNKSNLDMIGHAGPEDDYSVEFELALDSSVVSNNSEGKEQPELKFAKARSDFMSSQLIFSGLEDTEEANSVSDHEKTLAEPQQLGTDDKKGDVCSLPSQCSAPQEENIDHTNFCLSNTSSLNDIDKSINNVSSESSFVNIDSTPPHSSGDYVQAECFSTNSNISSTVGDSLFSGNSVPLKVSSGSLNSVGGGKLLEARNGSVTMEEDDHNKELDSSGDMPSSIVKMRLKLFEKSGEAEDGTKASKTRSNNKCVLHQKGESNSAPLDMLISRDTSLEQTDKNLLVEEDKVGLQEGQDEQEKSVGENDVSKEERFETVEIIETVGLPLNIESQSHIVDSIEYIDTEERMSNMTSSNISDMQKLDKSDIPKDTASIRVMEPCNIQTNLTLSKSVSARQDTDRTYPNELNPFGEDDDDTEQMNKQSISSKASKTKVVQEMNPFGSSDDEEEIRVTVEPPTPPVPVTRERTRKVLEAPEVCLNPFWSDGEEPSSGDENVGSTHVTREKHPVPRPRTVV